MKLTSIHRVVFFSIILAVPVTKAQSAYDSLNTFREIRFYSLPEEVEELESAKYMQEFTGFGIYAISYKGKFAGLDVRIDYTFREDKFKEGSYNIAESDNIREDFYSFQSELENIYGKPHFYSNRLISDKDIWIKESDYGSFKGPELYWQFKNGFIVLLASKFKEEESLTILFAVDKDIGSYGAEKVPLPK